MKRFLSAISVMIVTLLAATLIVPIAACSPDEGNCKIHVSSMGGLGLTEATVSVFSGNSKVAEGTTNEEGIYALDLNNGVYTVKLADLPEGYTPSDSYTIEVSDGNKEFNLGVSSSIITGKELPNKYFLTGDIMYDFTIDNSYNYAEIDNKGVIPAKSVSLAELFQDKKAVLLNFFYTTCSPCVQEIPAIMTALNEYADDMAVLGVDNYPTDTNALVSAFSSQYKVTYPLGMDSAGVCSRFNFNAYPTSIMIDRYGVITEFHVGSVTDVEFWRSWFKKYTADDYSQNFNVGNDINDSVVIEADKPADFGVFFTSNPQEISDRINKTGLNMSFSADSNEYSWPWELASDGESIIPTNSGHLYTPAIIYATVNLPAASVLTFEYKVSCRAEQDYFFVAVDASKGIGTQTLRDSGVKDWRTGYAYATLPLEAGTHEISFTYYKLSSDPAGSEDKVYVKNLQLITVDDMTRDLNAAGDYLDLPYYAARGFNPATGGYSNYSSVYFNSADGFYHVSNQASSAGDDPILFADMHNATPYFTSANASIFNNYISTSNCTFGGKDYFNELNSYSTWATNSDISGLVPVTEELKTILDALYKSENSPSSPQYNANGWLEFCAFYKHYGNGESIGNPIVGLAGFTAIEAHETTDTTGSSNLNTFTVNKLIMPRGVLFKFVPTKTGVYQISGASTYNGSTVGTDGWLYDADMKLASTYYNPINSCGADYYVRNVSSDFDFENVSFNMYHYLVQGKTYYVQVAFTNTDMTGDLSFRIDYLDTQSYKYLTTATAGTYYMSGAGIKIPVYVDYYFNETAGYYYSRGSEKPIFCDFTDLSRMFSRYSLGQLLGLQGNVKADGFFDLRIDDGNGGKTEGYITVNGEQLYCKDYTDIMKEYYQKSIAGKQTTDPEYGLCEVDKTLYTIINLIYAKNVGFDDPNEWLMACWYYDYTDASKPSPDTILWRAN